MKRRPAWTTPRRWRSHTWASLALAGVLGLLGGAAVNGWHWLPTGQAVLTGLERQSVTMPLLEPIRGRMLFISPHPDDETLAAAGIIQDVLQHRGEVWVVFLTCGDGFPFDARATARKPMVSAEDYLNLGRHRMQEARAATARLGVRPDHVLFLGFPDRGLSAVYHQNYLTPYRSPYTASDHVPYSGTVQPGAPYTGRELEREVGRLLDTLKPDTVLAPSAFDAHPDHRAAAYLATRLVSARPARLYNYLVHGGLEWPLPKGQHRDLPLTPPTAELQGARWNRYDLDAAQIDVKAEAVREYRSQTLLIGRFMWAFVRENELLLPAPGTEKP